MILQDEEFEALEKKCKELEESYSREERTRKEAESVIEKLNAERQALLLQLEQERDMTAEGEERAAKILAQKSDVEKQVRVGTNPISVFSLEFWESGERNHRLFPAKTKG